MTDATLFQILPLILIVAALYSSVGHGGASGYLAAISLVGLQAREFVPLVLILNILVAATSFLNFNRPGKFSFAKLLPFVISSIPAAYFGGALRTSNAVFEVLLGLALLAASIRLVLPTTHSENTQSTWWQRPALFWPFALVTGFILGFVSGMIGIGGGVFLSPILIMLGITDIKGSAAMASAFIVLNSLAGLAGHAGDIDALQFLSAAPVAGFISAALIGGYIGAHWGAVRTKPRSLQYVLATVLLLASGKLLLVVFS